MNWTNHDEEFIQTFESFILNLLSAHTHYLKMVIKSLIDRLKPCTFLFFLPSSECVSLRFILKYSFDVSFQAQLVVAVK